MKVLYLLNDGEQTCSKIKRISPSWSDVYVFATINDFELLSKHWGFDVESRTQDNHFCIFLSVSLSFSVLISVGWKKLFMIFVNNNFSFNVLSPFSRHFSLGESEYSFYAFIPIVICPPVKTLLFLFDTMLWRDKLLNDHKMKMLPLNLKHIYIV